MDNDGSCKPIWIKLEVMPPLKSSYIQTFERFADFVRISVVKLKQRGEMESLVRARYIVDLAAGSRPP